MTALAMAGIETFPSSFLQPGTATLILNLAQVVQLLADYCDTSSGISKSVTIADCHSNSVTLIVLHWISLSTWDLGVEEIHAISDFAL